MPDLLCTLHYLIPTELSEAGAALPTSQVSKERLRLLTYLTTGCHWASQHLGDSRSSHPSLICSFNLWPAWAPVSHPGLSSWGHNPASLFAAEASACTPRVDMQSPALACLLGPGKGALALRGDKPCHSSPPCLNPAGWDFRPRPGCYRHRAAGSPGLHTKSCCKLHHEWQPFFA